MKTRANNALKGKLRKRRRLNEPQDISQIQSILPLEVWLEIFRFLNKKQLRDIASVSKQCYVLTKTPSLFQEAAWPSLDYRKVTKQADLSAFASSYYKHYSFSNGLVVFAKEVIYLWHPFKTDYKKLKGHGARVIDMICFDDNQLISCDSEDIRIWDSKSLAKLHQMTHQQKCDVISLIALKDEKFACIYQNGVVGVWDRFKGEYIGSLLKESPIPHVVKMKQLHRQLILVHSETPVSGFKVANQIISVWGLDDGLLKMTLTLANYRDNLIEFIATHEKDESFAARYLVAAPRWSEKSAEEKAKRCCSFLAITHDGHYLIRFFDYIFLLNKNGQCSPLFLGVEVENIQYSALNNGSLAVVSQTCLGFEFLADYDSALNEFRIKHSFIDPNADSWREYLLMQDGGVVMHYGDSGDSKRWSMTTRQLLPDFKLHGHVIEGSGAARRVTLNLHRLPTGDILGCLYKGEIVIWDGQSGKVRNQLMVSKYRYIYCANLTSLLDNGDFLVEWNDRSFPSFNSDKHNKMIRFGLFDDKVSDNSDELNVTEKQTKTLNSM